MTIAIILDSIFPYQIGGIQKYGYELCKYLVQKKVHVYLYFSLSQEEKNPKGAFTEEELAYITIKLVKQPPKYSFPFHYIKECYEYSCNVYNTIDADIHNIDFICAVHGFSAWKLVIQKQKGQKIPPIMTDFHGMNMFLPIYGGVKTHIQAAVFRYFITQILQKSDYIRACGERFAQIIRACKITDKHIYKMPNLIGSEWLSEGGKKTNSPRVLLYVGRYDMAKGIKELEQSINQLIPEYDFHFHFVGPFPDNKKIQSDKVIYHGAILDKAKLKSIYEQADIFVLPSYTESMPLGILEAMACKCAIIATDVGAIPDIDNKNIGWLIPPNHQQNLYNAMKEAIEMKEDDLQLIQQQNYQKIKDTFIWDKYISVFIKDIKTIIEK